MAAFLVIRDQKTSIVTFDSDRKTNKTSENQSGRNSKAEKNSTITALNLTKITEATKPSSLNHEIVPTKRQLKFKD